MYIYRFFTIVMFQAISFVCPVWANYSLKDVMEADEKIAASRPSLLISDRTGGFLSIKGTRYQIRQFVFETKPIEDREKKNLTFAQVIEKYGQLSETPKQAPGVLYPVDYFSSTPKMKEDGFYYLLSLRELDSPIY